MYPRQPVPAALLALADRQAGAATRAQCLGHGLSRTALARLTGPGGWPRLCRAVYLLIGPPTWFSQAWAAVLVGGDGAVLAAEAAAFTHGLVDDPPDEIAVWLPADADLPLRRPEPPFGWSWRRQSLPHRRVSLLDDLPRTTVEDTVLDLVDLGDQRAALDWVTRAVQRRRTTPARLARAASARPRLCHRRLLGSLLEDVAAGAETPLELRYLRTVERAHGLPTGLRQRRRGLGVVDVAYDDFALLVELDGRLGHLGAGRFRDLERDNVAAVRGLTTLRYGGSDVAGRPCRVARQVATVLRDRGWSGLPARCPRCPAPPSSGWDW